MVQPYDSNLFYGKSRLLPGGRVQRSEQMGILSFNKKTAEKIFGKFYDKRRRL